MRFHGSVSYALLGSTLRACTRKARRRMDDKFGEDAAWQEELAVESRNFSILRQLNKHDSPWIHRVDTGLYLLAVDSVVLDCPEYSSHRSLERRPVRRPLVLLNTESENVVGRQGLVETIKTVSR